ncbi:hypothetical protein Tco_0839833 [Tanacetum coccineum]|uniref:Reverse transcriptase domain-containing protein n=1 Tax=Tanacetum coccineum TaxID=301880 RepID=A0ABQ5AWA6_9ASTR
MGFNLTKFNICPSFIEDLIAKGMSLRVADSHTGNHHEDRFTPLETIRMLLSIIWEKISFELEGEAFKLERRVHYQAPQSNLMYASMNALLSTLIIEELNELMELRDEAYENTRIYKERTKKWHDSRLRGDKNFKEGDKVLIFNSRFKMHPGKLKSKWYSPCVVKTVHPYGTIEIIDKNGVSFKVNGHRLKKYHDGYNNVEEKEVVELDD